MKLSLFLTLLIISLTTIFSNPLISKIANHAKYSSKRDTLLIIGNLLVERGYEYSFIPGVIANIFHEGKIGKFESSAYISLPDAEPQYLKFMDELYDYRNKYVLTSLKMANWKKGKFGLGCIQWAGRRTYDLFKLYQKECNYSDRITLE